MGETLIVSCRTVLDGFMVEERRVFGEDKAKVSGVLNGSDSNLHQLNQLN